MKNRELQRRIERRTASVWVIGQGYVGLTVAAEAAISGMTVLGIDTDGERVAALRAGELVVPGVSATTFFDARETGRLTFGTGVGPAASPDVALICVPTPLIDNRPDLTAIERAARWLAPHLRRPTLVILESTTYPGTTEQVVRPLLERKGQRAGRDFLLAYSPERIDPGNTKYGFRMTPRVVGGLEAVSTATAAAFYRQLVDEVVTVSGCRSAELAKLLENTFRMVNIALVNELAMLCAEQGIDVWEVVDAAATKPFGFMPFAPGPGVGGHCIPLDPTYLAWQSRRDTGRPFRLVELAQDVNAAMPSYVVDRLVAALNDRGQSVKDANVLALGVTYKPDVGDVRESAAIHVLEHLQRRGAKVSFHDPFVSRIDRGRLHLRRSALTRNQLARADCVVVLTPHQTYDLADVVAHSRLVFDVRNAVPRSLLGSVIRL